MPGEDEGDLLVGLDGELREGAEVLAPGVHFGFAAQPHRVGSCDGHPVPVGPAHPRHDRAVVEAEAEPAVDGDLAADAFHDAYDVGGAVALGHQVGDADRALVGLPLRVQDQGVGAVGAAGAAVRALGCDAPVAVVLVAEQSGEAGGRVEAWQAQPVDRAVHADQGRGLFVADEGVVLDTWVHGVRVPCLSVRQSRFGAGRVKRSPAHTVAGSASAVSSSFAAASRRSRASRRARTT